MRVAASATRATARVYSRRIASSILALGALTASGSGEAFECAPRRLLESRAQIDLAVQASSVQAWSAASEAASDSALDPASLSAAFKACSANSPGDVKEVVAGVETLRKQLRVLGDGGGSIEEAMSAMRTGTSTRNAMDRYLSVAGVEDG